MLEATSRTELAKATCVRGEIALLAGDLAAARTAHAAAREVADKLEASPRSELGRGLAALRQSIDTTTTPPKEIDS